MPARQASGNLCWRWSEPSRGQQVLSVEGDVVINEGGNCEVGMVVAWLHAAGQLQLAGRRLFKRPRVQLQGERWEGGGGGGPVLRCLALAEEMRCSCWGARTQAALQGQADAALGCLQAATRETASKQTAGRQRPPTCACRNSSSVPMSISTGSWGPLYPRTSSVASYCVAACCHPSPRYPANAFWPQGTWVGLQMGAKALTEQ